MAEGKDKKKQSPFERLTGGGLRKDQLRSDGMEAFNTLLGRAAKPKPKKK